VSATSMRPVCDLHDCSHIKMPFGNRTPFLIQDMVDWWFGLLSYACVLYTFQGENTYAKLHKNAPFEMKNYKNFLGRHCPLPRPLSHWGGGYPSRTPPPSAPSAPRRSCLPWAIATDVLILETPLKLCVLTRCLSSNSKNSCYKYLDALQVKIYWVVALNMA